MHKKSENQGYHLHLPNCEVDINIGNAKCARTIVRIGLSRYFSKSSRKIHFIFSPKLIARFTVFNFLKKLTVINDDDKFE